MKTPFVDVLKAYDSIMEKNVLYSAVIRNTIYHNKALDFQFDVIALSETWLIDNDSGGFNIYGYKMFTCSREQIKAEVELLYILMILCNTSTCQICLNALITVQM